jgi:hypothetical protein
MKKIKIALSALTLVAIVLASFAFTNHSANKKFSTVFYDYKRAANIITISDPDHLVVSELQSTSTQSWQSASQKTSGNSAELMQISFNDAELTLAQAVQGVADYYSANSTLPANGLTVPAKDAGNVNRNVTIYHAP